MNVTQIQLLEDACDDLVLGHQLAPLLEDESGERHSLVIMATNQDGLHTGRRRFLIACDTCGTLIHAATTGPAWRVVQHLREFRSTP